MHIIFFRLLLSTGTNRARCTWQCNYGSLLQVTIYRIILPPHNSFSGFGTEIWHLLHFAFSFQDPDPPMTPIIILFDIVRHAGIIPVIDFNMIHFKFFTFWTWLISHLSHVALNFIFNSVDANCQFNCQYLSSSSLRW